MIAGDRAHHRDSDDQDGSGPVVARLVRHGSRRDEHDATREGNADGVDDRSQEHDREEVLPKP